MGAFDGLRDGQITSGYFGNHTSTIDWCELNYTHTPYIAEFVNTLTNFPSILLGLYGCFATISSGIPKRYGLCYLGLTLIGIGSFGFHASLRWEWQLMDELPMIYVVSYGTYLTFDTLRSFEPRFGIWGPVVLSAWCIFVTLSYMYLPNPIYHQIAFASIVTGSTIRNIYLINSLPPKHPAKGLIGRTLAWGLGTFVLGFAVWNVDNIWCSELRVARTVIEPFGFLLEGHGYWHFMTGYGAFLIFTASIYLQLAHKVSPDAYTYNPREWVPIVRPIMPAATITLTSPTKIAVVREGKDAR